MLLRALLIAAFYTIELAGNEAGAHGTSMIRREEAGRQLEVSASGSFLAQHEEVASSTVDTVEVVPRHPDDSTNYGMQHVQIVDSDIAAQEVEQRTHSHVKTTELKEVLEHATPILVEPAEPDVRAGSKVTELKRTSFTETRTSTLDPKTCIQAVIVEPRKLKALLRVTLNALAQDEVDLVTVAHGDLNDAYVHSMDDSSSTLSQAKQKGRLTLLPLHVTDLGRDSLLQLSESEMDAIQYHNLYSRILKSHSFWERLSCDQVVTMQCDTLFCKGSKARLADFSKWSYIGGRTPYIHYPSGRMHMNGGFSFRRRPDVLACLDSLDGPNSAQEDIFFSQCPLLKQPSAHEADRFSMDNALVDPTEIPLAVHKPWGDGMYKEANKNICEGARELEKEQHRE